MVTNGTSYGHGCARLKVEVTDGAITRIVAVNQRRLHKYRNDPKLPPIPE